MTVTSQVAVTSLPSLAVTVMVAVPGATAVTVPLATVTTLALLVVHVTLLSVALSGMTVAVSVSLLPTVSVVLFLLSDMPFTGAKV